MAELLPATFAALGAVVGLIIGAILGRYVGFAMFAATNSDVYDLVAVTVGGLGGAVLLAWLGLRFAGRFAKPS